MSRRAVAWAPPLEPPPCVEHALRERIKTLNGSANQLRWQMAHLLLEVFERGLFREWGYRTMAAYGRGDLGISKVVVLQYLVAARHWRASTPVQRELLERRSPRTVYQNIPADERQVAHPQKRRGGSRTVTRLPAPAGGVLTVPRTVNTMANALCTAATLLNRGVPNDPAVHEWIARLREALAAYDQRRRPDGQDPRHAAARGVAA